MFQEYRDVADFRMVYIREAHAKDSRRPSRPAREKDISEHENFEQRCTTAKMLLDDEQLTIPCLIDSMDNKTDKAYSAKPDRAFLVGTDGKLVVAGARGPRGFKPALEDIKGWLEEQRDKPSEDKSKASGSAKKKDPAVNGKEDRIKKSDSGSTPVEEGSKAKAGSEKKTDKVK